MIEAGLIKTPVEIGACLAFATLGTLLPDIDTRSKLTNEDHLLGMISGAVRSMTKHRGATHTVLFAAAAGILTYYACLFLIPHVKESVYFFGAILIFILLHVGDKVKKYGGVIAIASFFVMPHTKTIAEAVTGTFMMPETAVIAGSAIFAGCMSHLLLDSLTKEGIMWFWPFSKRKFSLAGIRTGQKGERIVNSLLIAVSAVWIYRLFLMG